MLYQKPSTETRDLFLSAASQYSINDLESLPACAVGGTGCDNQQGGEDIGLIVFAFCAVGVDNADDFNGATVTAHLDCIGGGTDSISLELTGCSLQTDINAESFCPNGIPVLCSDAVPCSQFEGTCENDGPSSLSVSTPHGDVTCQDPGQIGGDNNNGG